MKSYTANNGKTLKAEMYRPGLEHDICLKHNKPVIYTNGKKKYVSTSDYMFKMDGEKEIYILNKDSFKSVTKRR
jgi:hypothetical protein